MLLSVSKLHEKRITESQDGRNFGGTRALIESFTTLQLCYRVTWKMHSFSAKQARVIFSSISLFMKSWVTAIGEINFLQFPSIVCWRRQIPHSSPQNHPFPSPPPTLHFKFKRFDEKANFYVTKLFNFPPTGMWPKRTNLCKSMLKIMFFQWRAYILRAPTCTGWNETERSSFLNEVVTNRPKHNIGGNNDYNDSNYNWKRNSPIDVSCKWLSLEYLFVYS